MGEDYKEYLPSSLLAVASTLHSFLFIMDFECCWLGLAGWLVGWLVSASAFYGKRRRRRRLIVTFIVGASSIAGHRTRVSQEILEIFSHRKPRRIDEKKLSC